MAAGGNILKLKQHPTGSNATGAAVSVTVAKPSGISILIASCRFTGGTATSVAITDNGANAGWNSLVQNLGATASLSVWWRLATPTDIANLTTVTFTPTGGTLTAAQAKVDEFTGNPATVAEDFQEGTAIVVLGRHRVHVLLGGPGAYQRQRGGAGLRRRGLDDCPHGNDSGRHRQHRCRGDPDRRHQRTARRGLGVLHCPDATSSSGIKFSWTTNSAGRLCFVVFSMPASAMPALLSV